MTMIRSTTLRTKKIPMIPEIMNPAQILKKETAKTTVKEKTTRATVTAKKAWKII